MGYRTPVGSFGKFWDENPKPKVDVKLDDLL